MRKMITGMMLMLLAPLAAQADVNAMLRLVPDEAVAIAVAPNIEQLGTDAKGFLKACGMPEAMLADVDSDSALTTMMQGYVEGVNTQGPIVLAFGPEGGDPILVFEAGDLAAWKKASNVQELEGGILSVDERAFYAYAKGGAVVLSEDRSFVQGAANSEGKFAKLVAGDMRAVAQDADAYVLVDFAGLQMKIDEGLMMMDMMAPMMLSQVPEGQKYMPLLQFATGGLRTVAKDCEMFGARVQMESEGLSIRKFMRFKEGGKVARYFKACKPMAMDALAYMGDKPGAMVYAMNWQVTGDVEPIQVRFVEAMQRMQWGTPDESEAMKDAMARVLPLLRNQTGGNVNLLVQPDGLLVLGSTLTDEPQKFLDVMDDMVEMSESMASAFAPGMKMDITASQTTIDGHQVKELRYDYSGDPQALASIEKIYGNPTYHYSAVVDGRVVYAYGPQESARNGIKKLLSTKTTLAGNSRLSEALGRIRSNPACLFALDLSESAKFVRRMMPGASAQSAGGAGPMIVGGCYLEPRGFSVDVYVPAPAVKMIFDQNSQPPLN